MKLIESIAELFGNWVTGLTTLAGGLQLVIIVGGALLAWFTHRRWQAFIIQRLGETERKGLLRVAMRGTERVVFPLSMLIYVLIGRGILAQFGLTTSLLNVLTPLLLSLAAIRIMAYILRRVFSPSPALRAWEGIISTVVWGVVALYLLGWLPDLLAALDRIAVNLGDKRFSLLSLVTLLIAVAIFIVAANLLSGFIEQRAKRSPYISVSMRVGLTKFSKFFLYTLAILLALNSVGIDLTTLTVFSGALGVGIGFGLQRIASNFISGFILLFDRSIRPGDVISIGDRFGWVKALHARYIVVRDRDGVETLIPNENLITSEVTNWSYSDRQVRIRIPVQISYDNDPEQALQILLDASKVNDRVLTDPEPQARLLGFGDNGIDLELRLWINDPEQGISSVKSDVNLAIWKQFKEHGISIPFPQRDVHIIEQKQN